MFYNHIISSKTITNIATIQNPTASYDCVASDSEV